MRYNYTTYQNPTFGEEYLLLSQVDYEDGTKALYTYAPPVANTRPLLLEANDPRYHGPATRIRYEFDTGTAAAEPWGTIKREINPGTGALLAVRSISHDRITVAYSNGGTVEWDAPGAWNGQIRAQIDALGNTKQFTYASAGLGYQTSETDREGRITRYQRNARGNLLKITHPDASFITYTRDSLGRLLSTKNELGRLTKLIRDSRGRVTRIDHPDATYETFTYNDLEWRLLAETHGADTPEAATTRYAYDKEGALIQLTDPLGRLTTTTYDNRRRRSTLTDPLGHVTGWFYDTTGNLLRIVDPLGRATVHTYDAMNRLASTTNANGETTSYTYDGADNILSLIDAKNNTYSFTYDLLNRRTRFNYPGGSYEAWNYNDTAAPGTLWTVYTARDGSTMSCTFDNRGRDLLCDYSAADTPDITYTYDTAGRRLSASTSAATHTYTYDAANQLLSETTTHAGLGIPFTVAYAYDADGNPASLTYPDNTVVEYTHTSRNQLQEVIANGPPPLATYGYNLNGQRTSKTLENGTVTDYTYDNANRLTRKTGKRLLFPSCTQ